MPASPKSVNIRTYQVGFGDCFLLSFKYSPTRERHVLIDFGTMALPRGAPRDQMVRVANDIKSRTGGKLHAVVATHRHRDHISGFTRKNGTGSGDIIRALKPDVVVQPWTEHPDLAKTATKPALRRFGAGSKGHIAALSHMNNVAELTVAASKRARHFSKELKQQLSFIGEDNIANADAVRNLMTMAPNVYVFSGTRSGLASALPGVAIDVLGPPTVEQHAKIKSYAEESTDYWSFQANALRMAAGGNRSKSVLFPRHVRSRGPNFPVDTRWLIYRARTVQGEQLLQIVRMLDGVMNNTSVILIFGVGSKRLLFPGDAQVENWDYALTVKRDRYEELLKGVNLYKVGHHGSLNATPKRLWNLFRNRSTSKTSPRRLQSLMSTLGDVHGHEERSTEVPRSTLVSALKSETKHFSTHEDDGHLLFHDTTMSFS